MKLGKFFTESEIRYIEYGDEDYHIHSDNSHVVNDSGDVYRMPSDIKTIIEILQEMDINERREVLRYVLEMKS